MVVASNAAIASALTAVEPRYRVPALRHLPAEHPGTGFSIVRWRIDSNVDSAQQRGGVMATRDEGRIIENPVEARQGERGPSVLALLTISTGLAVLVLGVIWFVWFRV